MQLSLLMQSVFYDRPRLFAKIRRLISNEDELIALIHSFSVNDPFRSEALLRMQRRERMLDQMRRHDIGWVDIHHALYPAQFHQLVDPPLGVFYRGDIHICSKKCLGMVGARRVSAMAPYRVASLMSVIDNYVIVSGGALGIDAMVHDQALSHGHPTISVLASGLDQMVPYTNRSLFQRIISSGQGCVISECPPGVKPRPYFFPQRNRLIAAFCSKLIVVEAAKRSGAVLTANLASDMASDVGAVVGAFNSPQSEGCYDLMNDGAMVIGNTKDLCRFIGIDPPKTGVMGSPKTVDEKALGVLAHVPVEPIHIEDLAKQFSFTIDEIIEQVTTLSLNGDVVISSGQMVSRSV